MRPTVFRVAAAALVLAAALTALAAPAAAQLPVTPYHTYATMKADLDRLAADHPDLVKVSVLGTTPRGSELWRVDVADMTDPQWESYPALLVDGGHHGNEALGIEAAYYFAESVALDAAEDRSILAGKRLVVVPAVNPDGWIQDSRVNGALVNLNRNYPWMWNERGTDPVRGQPNYAGPEAGSEAETKLMMQLMESADFRGYVTFHTGSFDLVLPWDPDEDAPIEDWDVYARFLAEAESATGLGYRPPGGLGESHAHAYGNLGIFGILPEVSEEQFLPVSAQAVRGRVAEGVTVARLAFDHLLHLGGRLEPVPGGDGTVLRNVGWGPAYVHGAPPVPPGGEIAVQGVLCDGVPYDRLRVSEATRRPMEFAPLPASCERGDAPSSSVPSAGVLALVVVASVVAATARSVRPR